MILLKMCSFLLRISLQLVFPSILCYQNFPQNIAHRELVAIPTHLHLPNLPHLPNQLDIKLISSKLFQPKINFLNKSFNSTEQKKTMRKNLEKFLI